MQRPKSAKKIDFISLYQRISLGLGVLITEKVVSLSLASRRRFPLNPTRIIVRDTICRDPLKFGRCKLNFRYGRCLTRYYISAGCRIALCLLWPRRVTAEWRTRIRIIEGSNKINETTVNLSLLGIFALHEAQSRQPIDRSGAKVHFSEQNGCFRKSIVITN